MRTCVLLLAGSLSLGCASQKLHQAEPLPFHVAVVPVDVRKADLFEVDEKDRADVVLAIDGARISRALTDRLDGKCFARATLLEAPADVAVAAVPGETWIAQARALGADLILASYLDYDEDVATELNDRFWLNLPLFLLGGPATWFVNDRSYHFQSRIRATVYDVTAAARQGNTLDPGSRVAVLDRSVESASLDFLDRASGAGAYALSLFVPSGFVAKSSKSVPGELEGVITEDLSTGLGLALQERSREVIESDMVAFHPESVRFREEGGERYLEGEMVLALGQVASLSPYRYRVDGGEWVEATWNEVQSDPGARERRYVLRVPVGKAAPGAVQLEVQQEDREASARTFTYAPAADQTRN